MLNDGLDSIRDIVRNADTNDWIVAITVGLIVQLVVLFIFRVIGIFFKTASYLIASLIALAFAIYILDRQGIPHAIGGKTIDRWIDDARDALGLK